MCYIPEHVGGELRVERVRVVVAALQQAGEVVGLLQAARVQVQRAAQEGGAGVAQVPAARPPPRRHAAQRRRRHQVPAAQTLRYNRRFIISENHVRECSEGLA